MNAASDSQGAHVALASLARRSSPAVLLSTECIGLAAILMIVALTPEPAPLSFPFVALVSFGLWGLADHARRQTLARTKRSAYSIFQLIVTVLGATSIIALMLALGGMAVGTIIS